MATALSRTPHPRGVDRPGDASSVDPRPLKALRLSGSKTRLLPAIGSLQPRTQRIVEPYLGPGALALNATAPAIGDKINRPMCEVWWWLQGATPAGIRDLGIWSDARRALDVKIYVWDLRSPIGAETWVRFNCASVVTGQGEHVTRCVKERMDPGTRGPGTCTVSISQFVRSRSLMTATPGLQPHERDPAETGPP